MPIKSVEEARRIFAEVESLESPLAVRRERKRQVAGYRTSLQETLTRLSAPRWDVVIAKSDVCGFANTRKTDSRFGRHETNNVHKCVVVEKLRQQGE